MDEVVNDIYQQELDLAAYNEIHDLLDHENNKQTQKIMDAIAQESLDDTNDVIKRFFEDTENANEIHRHIDTINNDFVKTAWSYKDARDTLYDKANSSDHLENMIYTLFCLSLFKKFRAYSASITLTNTKNLWETQKTYKDNAQKITTRIFDDASNNLVDNNNASFLDTLKRESHILEYFVYNILHEVDEKNRDNILTIFSHLQKFRIKTWQSRLMKSAKGAKYVTWHDAELDLFGGALAFDTLEELREQKEVLRQLCEQSWWKIRVVKESDKGVDEINDDLLSCLQDLTFENKEEHRKKLRYIANNSITYNKINRDFALNLLSACDAENNDDFEAKKASARPTTHNANSNSQTSPFHNLTIEVSWVPLELSFRISDQAQIKKIVHEHIQKNILVQEQTEKAIMLTFADEKSPMCINENQTNQELMQDLTATPQQHLHEYKPFVFWSNIINTLDILNHPSYKHTFNQQFVSLWKYSDFTRDEITADNFLTEIDNITTYIYRTFKNVSDTDDEKEILLVENESFPKDRHLSLIKLVLLSDYAQHKDKDKKRYIPPTVAENVRQQYNKTTQKYYATYHHLGYSRTTKQ